MFEALFDVSLVKIGATCGAEGAEGVRGTLILPAGGGGGGGGGGTELID
jgi:hypothetical protein